jgi:hypothetical protein
VSKAVISCRSLDHLIGPLLLVGASDELRISVLQGVPQCLIMPLIAASSGVATYFFTSCAQSCAMSVSPVLLDNICEQLRDTSGAQL